MKLPSRAAVPRCGAGSAPRRSPQGNGWMPGGRCSSASRPSGCSTPCCSTRRSCTPRRSATCCGGTADGNPSVIARPITWDATLVEHHLVLLNTIFATIQLLIGLGIAFRPTVRVALAASIAWSLGVWWFGEGLGGVLNGGASPLNGAPGAVIIYALLAVLLWPADRRCRRRRRRRSSPARAVGAQVARALWIVLWLSLAYFALTPHEPRAAGAERDDRGHGKRPARLAVRRLARRGLARRQPGAGRLDRARRGARGDRRRGLPAADRSPGPP